MNKYYRTLDAILFLVLSYHLVLAPFTKVEESFNIQAIHDILNYGVFPQETVLSNYDHVEFPGVVPRTFIGSLFVAGVTKVFLLFNSLFGIEYFQGTQLELQKLVRAIVGISNVFSLIYLRESLNKVNFRDKKKNNKGVIGFWYTVLLISQYHLLYYSSRTLPNFLALPLVNYSVGKLITGDLSGLTWLAFTGIIFRLEVGVFAGIIAVVSAFFGQSDLIHSFIYLAAGAIIGGLLSAVVDSYFWGRVLIPELDAFVFNVVQGKSVNWGVEPFGAYFKKYLWQLFRPPIILLLTIPGLIGDPTDEGVVTAEKDKKVVPHPARYSLRILFISSVLYILAMSFQPHKEWRFIVYVVPIFTLQAANGLTNVSTKWSASLLNKILLLLMVGTIALSTIISLQIGYISSYNYPGGYALQYTNDYILHHNLTDVSVHIDVPACMTGVTRFGELHNVGVAYNKTEDLTPEQLTQFDLIITHHNKLTEPWKHLQTIDSFIGVNVNTLSKILSDREKLVQLLKTVASEVTIGKANTWLDLLRSTVVTGDYLHVYVNEKETSK
ncbi:uncharacterized protein SPAPADRAFT_63472 [Spathaspora passalidarum NRRL Y-27907]|uniref:Mannosyltransferase n=1 Tax=Spathaspora passalidarum (strain NRRL Y-27907 / 11-Y1) TaxID=619300 RepID=G3AV00_SPAPN|nr:uncharacterized protein SPAPADRAFT_63472 [Spathaspora passalidarum NRRL Y-27907]EGW29857.1 hypothetical protein SPAPADRAFT_63472 [Spathaspora passalidarum NRRL Y-27907]